MSTDLLEIQPRELKFVFEVKKQSSCSIQLVNNSDQYVAFKVKTTSPKKYCVRPNAGIVKPNERCDFTVTLQAQRQAPPDKCKDKFLIQSTVVPFGTTEEEITSDMFAKDSGKYVEEKKLRVVLISPPNSPVLLPANGMLKQDPCYETPMQKDKVLSGVENIPPPDKVAKDEGFKTSKDVDELRTAKDVESRPNEDVEDLKLVKNVMDSKLSREFEELKLKRSVLESRLHEAELTIMKLAEERSIAAREKEMLKQELAVLRQKKGDVRRVHVGFPFLFVCMVALISLALGYLMRS